MAIITKTSVLLNSATIKAGDSWNLTEWISYAWADELTFVIDVQQTIGSPTSGLLLAKFQTRVPHKNGAIQFSTQRLVDLSPEDKAGMLVTGDWPATLADYSLAAPATYQRTIRNFGSGVNLNLSTSGLAGGTTPGFQVTVDIIAKGHS
ncbi:MAG: hypothetical protein H7288_11500 [Kineosporiaceae bacterium]|nr:hypothetical protein [Aeromicrobium sp.]